MFVEGAGGAPARAGAARAPPSRRCPPRRARAPGWWRVPAGGAAQKYPLPGRPGARVLARVSTDAERTHVDAPTTVYKSANGGTAASHAPKAAAYAYSAGTTSGATAASNFQQRTDDARTRGSFTARRG